MIVAVLEKCKSKCVLFKLNSKAIVYVCETPFTYKHAHTNTGIVKMPLSFQSQVETCERHPLACSHKGLGWRILPLRIGSMVGDYARILGMGREYTTKHGPIKVASVCFFITR